MKKITSIIFILIFFALFCVFEFIEHSGNHVLKVFSPTVIGVDFNNNDKIDENETICIPDVESFTANIPLNPVNTAKSMNISLADSLSAGYLADEFANKTLLNKKVKHRLTSKRTTDCRFAEIYINNEKYSDKLLNSGFGIKGTKPFNQTLFNSNLEKARKLNLVILNRKSNKYHTLDCKFGLKSSDFIILPLEDAKIYEKCRYCFNKKLKRKTPEKQKVKVYPEVLKKEDIVFILTDYTRHIKPDRSCSNIACKEFVRLINETNSTLDIALYGWDNIPDVIEAINRARNRGVTIRIIYDSNTNYYPETDNFVKSIENRRSDEIENYKALTAIIMHNKFAVSDEETLYTGSMNFSRTGFSGFNANNIVIIKSKEIAKLYTEEFNQMYSGKFHTLKKKNSSVNSFSINDTKISVYFSPQDKTITNAILPLINNAQKYIYVPAFIITHKDFTDALIRAKKRGVDVKIILDATSTRTRNSTHTIFRNAGLLLKTENYAGKVHSKSMIIDDRYVVTGSMNFSNSGENKNDENCLIIENEDIAKFYRGYFEYLWNKIPNYWLTHSVSAESKYSIGSCSDGLDNDFDGKIDEADEGCKSNK